MRHYKPWRDRHLTKGSSIKSVLTRADMSSSPGILDTYKGRNVKVTMVKAYNWTGYLAAYSPFLFITSLDAGNSPLSTQRQSVCNEEILFTLRRHHALNWLCDIDIRLTKKLFQNKNPVLPKFLEWKQDVFLTACNKQAYFI